MEFLHPFHAVEISSRYVETLPWQILIPWAYFAVKATSPHITFGRLCFAYLLVVCKPAAASELCGAKSGRRRADSSSKENCAS
jgi:hypothetical protein